MTRVTYSQECLTPRNRMVISPQQPASPLLARCHCPTGGHLFPPSSFSLSSEFLAPISSLPQRHRGLRINVACTDTLVRSLQPAPAPAGMSGHSWYENVMACEAVLPFYVENAGPVSTSVCDQSGCANTSARFCQHGEILGVERISL